VIAAAKDDLRALSRNGSFRPDLYYRLEVVEIALPPLRERREDIPLLFEHFVLEAAVRYGRPAPIVSRALIAEMMAQPWPGNLRELHNAANRFVLGVNDSFDGAADGEPPLGLTEQALRFERALIEAELRKHHGDVPAASGALGIPAKTLYDKLQRFKISSGRFRV
jgi:two-component system C4-dicarboxylate transport response regulator DctD